MGFWDFFKNKKNEDLNEIQPSLSKDASNDLVFAKGKYENQKIKVVKQLHPDYIKWIKPVHEHITGCKTYSHLPPNEELSLYHCKQIEKQEDQNELYRGIINNEQ